MFCGHDQIPLETPSTVKNRDLGTRTRTVYTYQPISAADYLAVVNTSIGLVPGFEMFVGSLHNISDIRPAC
jgi:hypothetical protein